jgi:hypothetical protein
MRRQAVRRGPPRAVSLAAAIAGAALGLRRCDRAGRRARAFEAETSRSACRPGRGPRAPRGSPRQPRSPPCSLTRRRRSTMPAFEQAAIYARDRSAHAVTSTFSRALCPPRCGGRGPGVVAAPACARRGSARRSSINPTVDLKNRRGTPCNRPLRSLAGNHCRPKVTPPRREVYSSRIHARGSQRRSGRHS